VVDACDARKDRRTRELRSYLDEKTVGAMFDTPICTEGRPVGILCHEHVGGTRARTAAEQQLALAIGQSLTAILEARARTMSEMVKPGVAVLVGGGSWDDRYSALGCITEQCENLVGRGRPSHRCRDAAQCDEVLSRQHTSRLIRQNGIGSDQPAQILSEHTSWHVSQLNSPANSPSVIGGGCSCSRVEAFGLISTN
jgi:hypothetical protein